MRAKDRGSGGAAVVTYAPINCKVAAVSDLTPTEKLFRIEMPGGRELGHRPGQFVQVSILGLAEAPISISSSPTREGYFELGVRRMGTLTNAMHGLKAGDTIGIRGPFGTSFDVERMAGEDLLLIAGGCGLAPMRSLIQYCEDRRDRFGKVTIVYGAKTPRDMLYKDEIEAWKGSDAFVCLDTVDMVPADDGEQKELLADSSVCVSTEETAPGGGRYDGHVGLITTLLPPLDIDVKKTIAVIVGPPVMYKFVLRELAKKKLPEERVVVSLERYMRCGVGKCGHCTIEHLYCCIDGPVFWLKEVSSLRDAI